MHTKIISNKKPRDIRQLRGKVTLNADYDYKALRKKIATTRKNNRTTP